MTDSRRDALECWLQQTLSASDFQLKLLAGDASFRRYFRVHESQHSYVAMDAPPDKESLDAYLRVTTHLNQAAVHVPEVLAEHLDEGFLLLEDLGDEQYLSCLNAQSADALYDDAIDALIRIQTLPRHTLPPYDATLLEQELNLFTDWYLWRHLQWEMSDSGQELIDQTWQALMMNALEQPQVVVHRDYHSRNLMRTEPNPGIIDHQDAVWGPVTYDLVSLLRDCYIAWPDEQVRRWAESYYRRAIDEKILEETIEFEQLMQWFDWMGVQRHLKAIGIFARLHHRDGKSSYLDDIPRILQYVQEVCAKHPPLQPFGHFIAQLPEGAA